METAERGAKAERMDRAWNKCLCCRTSSDPVSVLDMSLVSSLAAVLGASELECGQVDHSAWDWPIDLGGSLHIEMAGSPAERW